MAENLRRAAQSAPSHGSFLTGVKGNGAAPAAPADPKAKPKPGRGSRAPKAAKGSDANSGTGDDKKTQTQLHSKAWWKDLSVIDQSHGDPLLTDPSSICFDFEPYLSLVVFSLHINKNRS